ncbi:hypothetical protein [Prescottella equi]|uniref:hypothetical protein n=1 Tax=Rhodococcus hoagii TaxID=43767 RepID=UPI00111BE190|nr:hypothetical protein [Prescottella equi]
MHGQAGHEGDCDWITDLCAGEHLTNQVNAGENRQPSESNGDREEQLTHPVGLALYDNLLMQVIPQMLFHAAVERDIVDQLPGWVSARSFSSGYDGSSAS